MDKKIKVIVADDNSMIREMIVDSISDDANIEVVGVASEGNQTLEMIKANKPDVVLLDLVMPNVDGIDVMECINNDASYEGTKPYFIIISMNEYNSWSYQDPE